MGAPVWDPVESISRDEMAALQAERLRDCVARVAASVPMYEGRLGAAGITAEDVPSLDDLAPAALHRQAGPAGQLSLRAVRGADG